MYNTANGVGTNSAWNLIVSKCFGGQNGGQFALNGQNGSGQFSLSGSQDQSLSNIGLFDQIFNEIFGAPGAQPNGTSTLGAGGQFQLGANGANGQFQLGVNGQNGQFQLGASGAYGPQGYGNNYSGGSYQGYPQQYGHSGYHCRPRRHYSRRPRCRSHHHHHFACNTAPQPRYRVRCHTPRTTYIICNHEETIYRVHRRRPEPQVCEQPPVRRKPKTQVERDCIAPAKPKKRYKPIETARPCPTERKPARKPRRKPVEGAGVCTGKEKPTTRKIRRPKCRNTDRIKKHTAPKAPKVDKQPKVKKGCTAGVMA